MAGKQLSIYLTEPEIRLLTDLAVRECRRPNDQARHILRTALLGQFTTEVALPARGKPCPKCGSKNTSGPDGDIFHCFSCGHTWNES